MTERIAPPPGRHRTGTSPNRLGWLVLLFVAAVTIACLGASLLAWRQADQVDALRSTVSALEVDRQAWQAGLRALQATADAVDRRLSGLEGDGLDKPTVTPPVDPVMLALPEKVAALETSLPGLQAAVSSLQGEVDRLKARIEAEPAALTGSGGILPETVRLAVARQRQSHSLSCEASAASMAAQYLGLNLAESEVLAAIPLNANPNLGFRGNVDGPTGSTVDYGVYAGPVAAVLNERGLTAEAVQGGPEGIKAAVARGHPVLAWVTYNCLPSRRQTVTIDGQAVTLVPNQHVVVVTGYDAEGFWVNDPYDGGEDSYGAAEFAQCLAYFDGMALEVSGR